MRIRILAVLAIVLCAMSMNAQSIITWNASGVSSWGPSPWSPTSSNSNLTVGGLTRGSGVTTSGSAAANAWGGNGWNASASGGISGNQFATFTITANTGYSVSLSSFEMSYRRSSTGPSAGELQYSVNGSSYTTITTLSFSSTSTSGANAGVISLSGVSALQGVAAGSVITIRIVPYGSSSPSGTWYVNGSPSPSGLVISGTVDPAGGCTTVVPGTVSSSSGLNFCGSANPTLTLTGASSGTGITYQWQSSADSTSWSPISGATSTSYGPLSISTTTYYRAVTTCGTSGAKDSSSIGIHVTPLPTVVISGNAAVCSGGNSDITFTGTPNAVVAYTINGGSNQTITLDGSGNATVNTGALTADAVYALVNASINTCSQAQAGSATVMVNPLPVASLSGAATICAGDNTDITFSGTPNATITYDIDGGSPLVVVLDGSGNAIVNTGAISANTTYNLVTADDGTCTATLAGNVIITVNSLPSAVISGTVNICDGDNADITFTGTPNAVITYNIDGGSPLTITLDGAGDAIVNTGALNADVTYNIVDASLNSCLQALSGSATVSVMPLPTANISGSGVVCSGQSTNIIFSGTPNATVNYTVDGVPQTITLDGSGDASVNSGALTATTSYDLVDATSGGCGQALAGNATITVDPLPTAAISGSATVCSGSNTDITFTGTPNATVSYSINTSGIFTVVLDGTGNATVNTGNLTSTTTYEILDVNSGLCTATLTGDVTITVDPVPTATISGTADACIGNTAPISFNGTPGATVYYTVDGGSPQSIVLDMSGNAVVNTPVLSVNTTYTITGATFNACAGSLTGDAIITVSPAPTASISGTTTLSPANTTNITFTGTPGATVNYTVNGGPVQSIVLDGSGNAILNTGVLYYDATYSLVSVTSGCTEIVSGSAVVTMTIAYGPIYTYTNAQNGDYDFVATDATATDLTLYNGAAVSTTPCAAGYTTEGYDAAVSYDPLTNKAVTAKVIPDVMHRLIITGFSVGVRRSANGPQSIRLAYSLDNGNNWISSGLDHAPNNSTCDDIATYNWATQPFQVLSPTDGILFAVFGFDAATTTGQLQILNLVINGAVIETPLPVTLTSFAGDCRNNTMSFNWHVEKENNLAGYELEYSANGKNFSTVVSQPVTATKGGGNTYHATLYDAAEGLYRLASSDLGGATQYSKVLRVKCDDDIVATPTTINITGSTLTVRMGTGFNSNDKVSVQVFNMNGQLVSNSADNGYAPVIKQEVSLAQGVYLVRVIQGGVISTHKVMVN